MNEVRLPKVRRARGIAFLFLTMALCAQVAMGQTEARKPAQRVSGVVTAVDAAAGKMTLKSDAGGTAEVTFSGQTRCLRVPAGEKDPKNWPKIATTELAVGDRVVARGAAGDGGAIAATTILVMTKADVAGREDQEREDWRKRGISGTVAAIDPASKLITVTLRGRGAAGTMFVDAANVTAFRRYAPDSIRFADAKPGTFADLQVGDQLRALGERSADGTHYAAAQIVSGAFQTIAGTVVSVDAAGNTIHLTNTQTKQPVTVHVNGDALVRRLPAEMAGMLARRMGGGTTGGTGGPGGAGGQGWQHGPPGAAGAPGGGAGHASGSAGGGGAGNGASDIRQMLERLPAVSLADLKPGDALIVSGSKSADPSNLAAMTVVAGVEPFLAAAPRSRGGQVNLGSWSMDAGTPAE